ncbi:S8 family serine peptidase [Kribbella sp. CA-293567]|uniref:S8 family serine peptidase n=1 Tax=Kribbella sp. CA-293567 TaxID=3002436 RepID=UPI0022DE0E8D|nr:S8 family serine peptidase [Kribbella sp. CA-293567]WBQ06749.1 S8 family serine peptidase [Kribbella sp. CA-293567]
MSFRPAHLLRLGIPAALVAATLVTLTSSSSTAAPEPHKPKFRSHTAAKPEFEPNAVLVKFKKKASTAARNATASKLRTTAAKSVAGDVVKLTGDVPAAELLKKAKADPAVELASLNYRRYATATPNDYYYNSYQKGNLTGVRVPEAWDLSKTTGSQIIAVLDTGVDAGHPDLAGRLVPGFNATSPNRGPIDGDGHGTMTLGIIAAAANNGFGVAGVGWSAKAMPVKVLADDGGGYDVDVAEGIDWAVAHGAKVINMSLGGPGDNPVLRDSVQRAVAAGVVVIAAAGNDGSDVWQYPAAYPEVIAVGATSANGTLTDFSSFGSWVDIAAPGVNILSTYPRYPQDPEDVPYAFCTGTSCSAPIVAGVAALVKNKWPAFTPAQVEQRLKVLSRDAGPRGTDQYYGAGILDAYAALGGKLGANFAGGAADGNDQPARATKITATAKGVIDTEGDVDWYAVDSAAARNLRVAVTGAEFNSDEHLTNVGPRVKVYDSTLHLLGSAENAFPDEVDPDGWPIWEPLTAVADVSARTGTTYIAVSNTNGSRDGRQYSVSVTEDGAGGTGSILDPYPAMNLSPATNSSTATAATTPTVTFAEPVNEGTVNEQSVRIVHGRTGARIPATVSYNAATLTATVTPTAPLTEATPYKLEIQGVDDLGSLQSVFSTVDLVPQKLTTFTASGAYKAASVAWTIPATPDLDQVIVRMNVGGRAPTLTTGTLVYAGTGTSVKVTGLATATTYTFAGWVKDRSGKTSPISAKAVSGVKSGISTTASAINYGGTITLKGSVLRIDNQAYAGLPVQLYGRAKNVAALKLIATLKTSSTGTVSYAVKPATSSVYTMVFVGNADLMGTRTADISVAVAPTVSSVLAPTAITLGKTTKLSGYVAPAHPGKLVYLQFYSAKTWRNIASVKLTTSGGYAFGIKPAARGSFAYRVLFTADADHAQALSPQRIVKVS